MFEILPLTPELLAELGDELGGCDFTDPSQIDFLAKAAPCDVQAAPGNGKTTLLAAKLALLSRNWTIFERYLSDARYVGEIGLDAGPRFYRSFPAQERVFERILRACAEQGGKILTVHSVRAVGKVLNHIESSLPQDRGRVVMHWFTGTSAEARRAVALGCYFSINGEMLRSPKHRQLVGSLPLDRLLTETDGPFVERDGQPLRPRDVGHTVAELAEARNVSAKAMEDAVLQNLGRVDELTQV